MKKKILLGILAILFIAQFFRIDKTNPPANLDQDFLNLNNAPTEIALIFKDACYDCHSNETEYPWYTNITPVNFWIKGHINGARDNVNYSEWGSFTENKQAHKMEESIEVLEDGRMPAKSFVLMHPEAKLSDQQKADLINWLKSKLI